MTDNSSNFRDDISSFLKHNFPQIEMHGGESNIIEANEETGYVHINLSGACSGCGISPMTVEAIKRRMFQEIEVVEDIEVTTGFDSIGNTQQPVSFERNKDDKEKNSGIDVPF